MANAAGLRENLAPLRLFGGECVGGLLRAGLRRGNEIVNLTRTEWNLLQCLASNADKLMMNAELLGKVWGPEYVSDLDRKSTRLNSSHT